jgi:hypothetical protein
VLNPIDPDSEADVWLRWAEQYSRSIDPCASDRPVTKEKVRRGNGLNAAFGFTLPLKTRRSTCLAGGVRWMPPPISSSYDWQMNRRGQRKCVSFTRG